MYWKILKWGGTALLVAICGVAFLEARNSGSTDPATPDPQAPAVQPAKKFNF